VDVAADREGALLAVVAPGNHGSLMQVHMLPVSQLMAANGIAGNGAGGAGGSAAGLPTAGAIAIDDAALVKGGPNAGSICMGTTTQMNPQGQAVAVTFASPYVVAVQEREPAAVSFFDLRTGGLRARVELGQATRADTGHDLFHVRAGAGVACASCHPEGGDDGHVWTFEKIGARRTQTLRGGILGTEPLHWNGDMQDFGKLMDEVFVGRMSGFATSSDQTDALAKWLDKQPALRDDGADAAAVARGKVLFESEEVGCAECHSGPHLTNNETKDVGTGAMLQVPTLKGLKFRAPFMHDGCAATVKERFTKPKCGGGDEHGTVSQLSDAQVNDLTAYLETL
jgi:cytochrome c553